MAYQGEDYHIAMATSNLLAEVLGVSQISEGTISQTRKRKLRAFCPNQTAT